MKKRIYFLLPGALITAIAWAPLSPKEDSLPRLTLQTEAMTQEFVMVRRGAFLMGNNSHYEKPGSFGEVLHAGKVPVDEGPERWTAITKDFYIAVTPVTVQQFVSFLNVTEDAEKYFISTNKWCRIVRDAEGRFMPRPGTGDYAVNTIRWEGAMQFCTWLSTETGLPIRLPTEAEWEYAARGSEGRRFAWGNEHDRKHLQRAGSPEGAPWAGVPVGSYPERATPTGIFDMSGPSKGEWVFDWYARSYDPNQNIDPTGPASPTDDRLRVVRGRLADVTDRALIDENIMHEYGFLGFRLVVAPPHDNITAAAAESSDDDSSE